MIDRLTVLFRFFIWLVSTVTVIIPILCWIIFNIDWIYDGVKWIDLPLKKKKRAN